MYVYVSACIWGKCPYFYYNFVFIQGRLKYNPCDTDLENVRNG